MKNSPQELVVMKFGGASVKDAPAVRNVAEILSQVLAPEQKAVVVISAMDKTTNELEKLAWLARDQREADTWTQFEKVQKFHFAIAEELFDGELDAIRTLITPYFEELEQILRGVLLLGDFPSRTYDRIVAFGELLSTNIVNLYFQRHGLSACWADVRHYIKTDMEPRGANVIWSLTRKAIQDEFSQLFQQFPVVVTQGFIGSTMENKTTTLGREGSDYTAAIFANALGAQRLTVWKDVAGILSGDPRIEEKTEKLDRLTYQEAVEMTFYGATVIHPKTIKPLYEKGIPLEVRCFKAPEAEGSLIGSEPRRSEQQGVCTRIVRRDQALIALTPKDFSFMDERMLNRVFTEASRAGITLRLVQTSAISLQLCVDNHPDAIDRFESQVLDKFSFEMRDGLILRSLVNYGESDLNEAKGALLVQIEGRKLHIVKEEK